MVIIFECCVLSVESGSGMMNEKNQEKTEIKYKVEGEPVYSSAIECPICGYINTYEYDETGLTLISDKCEHFEGLDDDNYDIVIFKGEPKEKQLSEVGVESDLFDLGYRTEGHIPDLVIEKVKGATYEDFKEVFGKKYERIWLWIRNHDQKKLITRDIGNSHISIIGRPPDNFIKCLIDRLKEETAIWNLERHYSLSELEELGEDMKKDDYDEKTIDYFIETLRDFGD